MADYLRLRQICLAAPKLEPVVSDIHDIFGVEVCYRDPNVGAFGLQNALFVIGTNFLEIVSPTTAEKILKKDYAVLKDLVTQSDPQLRLVPLDHKGEAVTPIQFIPTQEPGLI